MVDLKRALVTGGAGFIGSHLVDKLLENDCEVFVVDNLRSGGWDNLLDYFNHSNCILEEEDICSPNMDSVFRVFRPEVVFHLAAVPGVEQSTLYPVESCETNIYGTANVLNYCKKYETRRLVFASSSSVYRDDSDEPVHEGTDVNPQSPYALQKLVGERYCKYYSDIEGIDTVALRYFNVFGPRQDGRSPYSAVVPAFLEAKKEGHKPVIFGDGKQTRDFCYVSNIVEANILAARVEDRLFGGCYNIGSGDQISVNQIHKMLDLDDPEYLPERNGDVRSSCAGISKAKSIFGYEPKVSFRDGLKMTEEWYLGQKRG